MVYNGIPVNPFGFPTTTGTSNIFFQAPLSLPPATPVNPMYISWTDHQASLKRQEEGLRKQIADEDEKAKKEWKEYWAKRCEETADILKEKKKALEEDAVYFGWRPVKKNGKQGWEDPDKVWHQYVTRELINSHGKEVAKAFKALRKRPNNLPVIYETMD